MKKLVSALCIALSLASASAGAQRVFSMATLAPEGSTWMQVFGAANRELRRRTSNTLGLRWYPGGVQGDEAEVIRKIRTGRLDGAAVTAVGLGVVHRPILAFQAPGMFANSTELNHARDRLQADLEQAFSTAGITLLGFGGTGEPRMMSVREIRVPTDLRSAHPWQWRDDLILPALFAEVGATGVRLQVPEVQSALQTNRVDTVVASAAVAIALQWAATIRYISAGSDTASIGGLIVSKSVFDTLTPDQQTVIRDVFRQYNQLLARNVTRDDGRAAQALVTRGVTVIQMTPAERAQWVAAFTGTRNRLVGVVGDRAWFDRVRNASH